MGTGRGSRHWVHPAIRVAGLLEEVTSATGVSIDLNIGVQDAPQRGTTTISTGHNLVVVQERPVTIAVPEILRRCDVKRSYHPAQINALHLSQSHQVCRHSVRTFTSHCQTNRLKVIHIALSTACLKNSSLFSKPVKIATCWTLTSRLAPVIYNCAIELPRYIGVSPRITMNRGLQE